MSKKTDSLPYSENCEMGLLGAFIANPGKVYDKCHFRGVEDKWFHGCDHGTLYTALCEMKQKGLFMGDHLPLVERPNYVVPVSQYCLDNNARLKFEHTDLDHWIMGIGTKFASTSSNIDYYIDKVQEKAAHRLGYVAALNLAQQLKAPGLSTQEVSDLLSGAFVEARELCAVRDPRDFNKEAVLELLDSFDSDAKREDEASFIRTTFPTLNNKVGGTRPGQLIVVHGIPSSGKSTLVRNWLRCASYEQSIPTALFSLEMTHKECVECIIADMTCIDLYEIQRRKITTIEDVRSFQNAAEWLSKGVLDIFDPKRMRMTPESIRARIRQVVKNNGVKMVGVDYLQLLQMPQSKAARRDLDLSQFTASLKQDAIELGIVILLVAAENNTGGVRDSGGVEYDGDNILRMKCKINEEGDVDDTVAVLVKKWRGSSRGYNIPVTLHGKYCRFEEGRTDNAKPTQKKTYQKRY